MPTMPTVRFLIGGVQKAGTTALARFLGAHPAVALPVGKEAHVFDDPAFDEAWTAAAVDARYAPHFAAADPACLHGDATPIYLLHPRLLARIARYNPAMRWIVLLRHPVERAVSHYHMERQRGAERWPLWPALLLESWRLRGHRDDWSPDSPLRRCSYRLRGDYARQLDALYARFPKEQVLLLRNDELARAPAETVDRVCAFLRIAPAGAPERHGRVFQGAYAPLARGSVGWRLLAWWMRRELRDARLRYGIDWA